MTATGGWEVQQNCALRLAFRLPILTGTGGRAVATAVFNTPFLASFESYLAQARELQARGEGRLARDHVLAALGVAMAAARQEAETAVGFGATVAEALDAGIAKLIGIRDATR